MNTVCSHSVLHHLPEAKNASSSLMLAKGGALSVLLCSALLCPPDAQAAESSVSGAGSLVVTGKAAVAKDGTSYTLADDANVYGNKGDGDIAGASLSIDGNNALGDVAGGFSNYNSATGGNTSSNVVTVKNSTAWIVYGGTNEENDAATGPWSCNSNTVTITDSEFQTVYGGFAPNSGQSDNNVVSVY